MTKRTNIFFLIAACTKPTAETTITVAAAVSLKEPLEDLAKKFEASHAHVHVALDLGASGELATQISKGAPVELARTYNPVNMPDADHEKQIGECLDVARLNGQYMFLRVDGLVELPLFNEL